MRIGLYGVSCAGKDFLIEKACRAIPKLKHIPGSATLKQLACKQFGKQFDEMTEDEKKQLRIAFTREVEKIESESEEKNIIIDGHYAFIKQNKELYTVLTDADRDLYDTFIYLNTPPARITKNQQYSSLKRKITFYTEEEVKQWQNFEIAEMQTMCEKLGKELIVIDGDIHYCTQFLHDLVTKPSVIDPDAVVREIIVKHTNLLRGIDTVILLDCDRTLANNDTTMSFLEMADIEKQKIKEIYKGEYYSSYQSYKASSIYNEVSRSSYFAACDFAVSKAQYNTYLISDIKRGTRPYLTMGITAGIVDIWHKLKHKIQLPQILIGKERDSEGVYISATTKRILAEELRSLGKQVIALGDSKIDIGMLEAANKGYIVADEKLNTWAEDYFKNKAITHIQQLTYSNFKYKNIAEATSIWA